MARIPAPLSHDARPARRFHAFNVGLPKTGTTSMAGIFSEYRSGHEFMFREMMTALGDRALGVITDDEFRTLVVARDRLGCLELDSASFAWSYVDVLGREYPDARFFLTIRDCYSWLESILNLSLQIGPAMEEFLLYSGRAMHPIPMEREHLVSREAFLAALPKLLDGFFEFWARGNALALGNLPPERSLVLRTQDLGKRLTEIAALVGVPVDTLRADQAHLFPAPSRSELLADLDPALVQERADRICGPLMDRFYPGRRLADFLSERRSL